jgi:WD40 repeat protein
VEEKNALERTHPSKHADAITGLAISSDGKYAVSSSFDKTLLVWEVITGTGRRSVVVISGHTAEVSSVAFTPDGLTIISGSWDRSVRAWRIRYDGSNMQVSPAGVMEQHTDWVTHVATAADGVRCVSASDDQSLIIWNHDKAQALFVLKGHSDAVLRCLVSRDSSKVVSCSADHTLRTWSMSGKMLAWLRGEPPKQPGHSGVVTVVKISPDGKKVVSGSSEGDLRVWKLKTGAQILCMTAHTLAVSDIDIEHSSKSAASVSYDGWVMITRCSLLKDEGGVGQRDELDIDPERKFKAHDGPVLVVLYTHDGQRLLTGSQDGRIGVWNATSDVAQPLAMIGTADLNPVGEAASSSDLRAIRHILLNKDSTKVVVASDDGYVRVCHAVHASIWFTMRIFMPWNPLSTQVYDVQGTSKRLQRCCGHEQAVNSVVCIPRSGTSLVRHAEACGHNSELNIVSSFRFSHALVTELSVFGTTKAVPKWRR